MKKIVMSITSASALLLGVASANEYQSYIISSDSAPVARMANVVNSEQARFARLEAINSVNLRTAADASAAGVLVENQLSNLGAISFADMTKEQVEAMRAMGYTVERQHMYHLVGMEQPFPGITNGRYELFADTIPYGIARVEADQTWADAAGAGVRTCIIDTGLDLDHPDLETNYITGTRTTGGTSPQDGNGHGTHVAGTVAGNLDGSGIVGVAPETDLYIAAVFGSSGSTTSAAILAGLDWCVEQNAQVANMSYGGGGSSSSVENAYQEAYDSGMVMVAATGNSGSFTPIGFPARYDTTIAVGATDSNDNIASFSQRGSEIDVVAPGVAVVSANNGGGTRSLSGTSMASPHVAGAAAAILSYQPGLSIEEVRSVLRDTADDLGSSGFDTTYGAGRINVRSAIDSLGGGGNRPPTAAFSFDADLLTVSFSDDSSDSDGDIVSWDWDFGDGASSSAQSPSHTYSANGSYLVSLTVTDDGGASRTTSEEITVSDGTSPIIDASVSAGGFFNWFEFISWSGATTASVDIYRNGSYLVTTANDGEYSSFTFGASYTYVVCEAGSTSACSEPASR